MALDKTQLVNRACTIIGADPIDSLDENTAGARIVSLRYDSILEAMVSVPVAWTFAQQTFQLSQLDGVTVLAGWTYAYALPGARIGDILKITDTPTDPDRKFDRFSREGNYILADATELYCRCKVLPDPVAMTGAFRIAFEHGLAAALAMGLASDKKLFDSLWEKAFGPPSMNMLGGLLGAAAQANKSAEPTRGPMTYADPLTDLWRS